MSSPCEVLLKRVVTNDHITTHFNIQIESILTLDLHCSILPGMSGSIIPDFPIVFYVV
jgi:hypothetical protein